MRKIYSSLVCCAMFTLILGACQKQAAKYTVTTGSFPTNALTVSTASPALADSIKNDTAITFNWKAAIYGGEVPISYSLQLDVASDTGGTNGWSKAQTTYIGSAYSYGLTVLALNTVAGNFGLSTGTPGIILARVRADVNQNSGSASTVPSSFSNVLPITVIPYSVLLYVPSSSYGWNFTYAPELNVIPDSTGKYEGYVYLPGTGTQYFKYTGSRSFTGTDYGDGGGGILTATTGTTGGMSVPNGGYYEVTADFTKSTPTWTASQTTWAIVGDATPKGWTGAFDNEMTYDTVNKYWFIDSLVMTNGGSFKFRANDAWSIDVTCVPATVNTSGSSVTTSVVYVDNPFFAYNNLPNATITTNGTFKVILDLHVSGTYTATFIKE